MLFFMKHKLLILIGTLFSFCASAQSDYAFYPRYKEVVQFYYTTYAASNVAENDILKFEKRPDGWHACVYGYSAAYPLKKEGLLWSLQTKSFEEIPFFKRSSEEGENKDYKRALDNWEAVHFDATPYFGYSGSDWDVIKAYGNAQNLPDTMLYGVGRAYSTYASNLLNNNSGSSDSTHRFVLKDGRNALSAEQLKTYRFYRYKAIDYFKQVNTRNPAFETLIGSIGLKLAHEYVTGFLEMRQYQNDEEAIKELPDAIYSDFYISLAKNYLNTCDKNAILFVNGDTDTYVLLYVQAKYRFRTDVTVINAGLLQTTRYINHLQYPYLGTEGLHFSHTAEAIADHNHDVIYVQTSEDKEWKVKDLIAFVNDPKNITALEQGSVYIVNGKTLKVEVKRKAITWPITTVEYMLKDEMMMMDILLNYGNTRPIYFAQTLSPDKYLRLNNYLNFEGLAYRLQNKIAEPIMTDGSIATDILFKNLMSVFTWEGNNQLTQLDTRLVANYTSEFGWLVYMLMQENKNQKAKEALAYYFEKFPNTYCPYDNSVTFLMNSYYALGEIDKANDIGKTILLNIQQKRIHKKSLFDAETESMQNEKAIATIKEAAEKNNQQLFYKAFFE
jgi:hypothetical protein